MTFLDGLALGVFLGLGLGLLLGLVIIPLAVDFWAAAVRQSRVR